MMVQVRNKWGVIWRYFIYLLRRRAEASDVTHHLRKSVQSVDKISLENPQISQIRTDLLHGKCDFS